LCYILCRKNTKVALISSALIGLNNYSRIGLIEPILNMVFILIFILLQSPKSNLRFVFVGVILVAAVMLKWTAVYFFLPLGLYLICLVLRKEIRLNQVVILGVTVLILLSVIYLFYYDNYLFHFSKTLSFIINNGVSKEKSITLKKIIYFFSKPTFSHPSVFILLLLCIIYALKSKFWLIFESPLSYIKSISKLELISYCWLLGYSFALFFSDFSERRFLILIVPMAILSAQVFSLKEEFYYPSKIKLSSVLLTVFILNGMCVVLQYLSNTYSISITIIISVVAFAFIIASFLIKSKSTIKLYFIFCIFCLVFSCFSVLVFYMLDASSLAFDFEIGRGFRYFITALVAVLILYLLIKQTKILTHLLLVGYLLLGLIVISYQHSNTTYNYYTHNLVVKKMFNPNENVTGLPHLFTLYNEVMPIRFDSETKLNESKIKKCEFAIKVEWITHYPMVLNSSLTLSNDFVSIGEFPLSTLNKKSRVKIEYFKRNK